MRNFLEESGTLSYGTDIEISIIKNFLDPITTQRFTDLCKTKPKTSPITQKVWFIMFLGSKDRFYK